MATLWQRFGITRLADVTGLDTLGVPVFQAVRPGSRNICVSQGKGPTTETARVSALMEAIELAHAESLDHLDQRRDNVAAIEACNSIRAESLPWLRPSALHCHRELRWLPAKSLAGGADGWLPREMIELDFSVGFTSHAPRLHRSSNGLSSGNVQQEALAHALCELIERHALARIQAQPTSKRPIDTRRLRDSVGHELVVQIRAAGAKVALFDVTSEIGVPTVAAEIVMPDIPRIWTGSGCHLAGDVAVIRALTEAAQSRLTFISGTRDDLEDPRSGGPVVRDPYVEFEELQPGLDPTELPDLSTSDLESDVKILIDRLATAGHPPYFVDLSHDDIGVAVVRAFAPGLGEALHA